MARFTPFPFEYFTEILSSPLVKPLAQRLQPSTVISVLRGVFDDVTTEVRYAVNEQKLPDLNILVDKVVARLADALELTDPLVVDARGRLFPNSVERLADAALNEGVWASATPQSPQTRKQELQREKTTLALLARLGGSEAALVFNSAEAARVAILQNLYASGKELVVARRDMYEREDGERLERAFNVFPRQRRLEIGACNAVDFNDYERACTPETGLVWRSFCRWEPEGRYVPCADVAKLKGVGGRNFKLLADVEFAPLVDLSEYFDATVPTVADRFRQGVDLVICDGAQLIGGPNCGLLFGPKSVLEELRNQPAYYLCQPSSSVSAALAKTIQLYDDPEKALAAIPALRLLSTSLANLENRAKRLANLLETFQNVQFARPVEGRGVLCVNASIGVFPSWLVELKPRGASPAEFAAKLEKTTPSLLVRWNRDVVLLDMRTLPPELDLVVVDVFESLNAQ